MVVIFLWDLIGKKANRTPRIHLLVVSSFSVLNGFIVRGFIIVEFIVTVGRIELPRDKQKTVRKQVVVMSTSDLSNELKVRQNATFQDNDFKHLGASSNTSI